MLRKLWQGLGTPTGIKGRRVAEYALVAGYIGLSVLAVTLGLTAKAGSLFARSAPQDNLTRPELRAAIKQVAIAGADLSAGAGLLIIAVFLLYWSRRSKATRPEALAARPGPPFFF